MSCTVCFEEFGKYRKPVDCPSCPSDKPPSVCRSCTEEYLLETPKEAHCMQCSHAWGNDFMHKTFKKDFLLKTYRQKRQEKSLEREKGLLQQTLPLVALEKEKEEARKKLAVLRKQEIALKNEYREKFNVINVEILETQRILKSATTTKATKYLFPCPSVVKKQQCRGYIKEDSWSCELCEMEVCKKCHGIKKEKHKCKKEDVESAKTVMSETKPCPKCTCRIFKIEGCDQMFCTQCLTAFSWQTGNIAKGVIHNPHYYEMLRKTGGVAPRNAGDVPCGGVPFFDVIHQHSKFTNDETREKVTTFHRRCGEIENYLRRQRQRYNERTFEDIRLNWLLGKYKDENAWKRAIFTRERILEKKKEEIDILDTFLTGCIERFNDYINTCATAKRQEIQKNTNKLVSDMYQILEFCNEAFENNFKAMEYKIWPYIDLSKEYGSKTRRKVVAGGVHRGE